MMLQEDRHQRIRALLATVGRATTDRIATDLGVSRETVRRDVLALEARGELRRVHGGVAAIAEPEPPITVRARVRLAEKTRIAQAAARLVSPGQTLFLDVGSTVSILARELATLSGLTIVTNSFEVATIIGGSSGERSNRVIVLGGELGSTMPATFGSTTVAEIQRWQADVALLSPVGIDHRYGATSFDLEEANVARAMVAAAKRVLILADHSKIGQTSRVAYCAPDRIDSLITDARAAEDAALGALRTVVGGVVIA
ncbi:DeoR/GlpR family DNA-binding transcription regulator [Bradyrhizobium ontarionense]|uniref:DeoR/GlpR family DNA-binding transcription regulator n=1 Tax=Bradyrhizobium ontarionense TaxID=2898149 RepID=A0ABY3RD17_9BRAD|nr:DeoR/GlpR family DNA-binding transcription regulator [Bradyrhizobium sp. A19]UFZ05188.1 DeoR/GlpR family DNA-binding transcription regulator [Bradyrhizobium sp. A19]